MVSSPSSPTTSTSSTTSRKRVSAEHTLSRVRENQRRHRARRKNYIASLEQQLAATQAQLAAARAEIETLKREREDSLAGRNTPYVEAQDMTRLFDAATATFELDIPMGPPPCCSDPASASTPAASRAPTPTPTPGPGPECSTCHTRPAPASTESTTLCAQACVLIEQQNFRGIDAATIRRWLYRGYRRAQREGEGCRVENGALFRLLDYISGM